MRLHGVIYFVLLWISGFLSVVVLIPVILTLPLHVYHIIRIRRMYIALSSGLFFDFAAALIATLCGTKVFIYSASPDFMYDHGALLISNHRTRVDWMFIWCLAALCKLNSEVRVILKDSLRSVPVFGWGAQLMMYIFLRRKRDSDIPHIIRTLSYLLSTGGKPSVLIFPEGTDLSPSNVSKSNAFALANGLQQYNYVLHPKAGALIACLSALSGRGLALLDITIAYRDFYPDKRTSERIFRGEFPREVHFVVDRYEIDRLPKDAKSIDQWVRDSFARKEALLKDFYSRDPTTTGGPDGVTNSTSSNESSCSIGSGGSSRTESGVSWPPLIRARPDPVRPLVLMSIAIFSLVLGLYVAVWFRWVCMCLIVVCVGARAARGFDSLELALHGDMMIAHMNDSTRMSAGGQGRGLEHEQQDADRDTLARAHAVVSKKTQ